MTEPIEDEVARGLIERCAQRDERALTELHRLMARRIYAFAFHRLRDEEAAQTVVVDALHEVWKCAAKFRGESRVSTWILGIARYKMMAHWRQAAGELEHEDIADYAETLPSDLDDGAKALSRWQEQQVVSVCMNELSAVQRECVQLVYFEGMGLSEVAAIQQTPENTVKTRLFHARKSMRLCVQRNGGDPT